MYVVYGYYDVVRVDICDIGRVVFSYCWNVYVWLVVVFIVNKIKLFVNNMFIVDNFIYDLFS